MDSMMAIEVKNRVGVSTKVDISVLELLQGVTITQLAGRILASLEFAATTPSTGDEALAETAAPADEIEQLLALADSDELERLLAELEQNTETPGLEVRK
jgi:hypothetical protein